MKYFEDEPVGTLVALEPEEMAGLEHHIWFPYARDFMAKVREGALVAVRNFNTWGNEPRYSVLELVEVLPVHYALGSSPGQAERAFPGFVTEAARSAKQDWEQETPTEESTQIRSVAIPTGVEVSFDGTSGSGPLQLHDDNSLPMQGENVRLLLPDVVQRIMNQDLTHDGIPTIPIGSLVHTPEAEVLVRTDELLAKHFGVFGFTGAGKSNLMSTVVSRLVASDNGPRVVLFDLMSEYIPLLVDVVDSLDHAIILALEPESLPGGESTQDYLWNGGDPGDAAEAMARTQLLPSDLADLGDELTSCLRRVLSDGKIQVWDPGAETVRADDLHEDLLDMASSARGGSSGPLRRWILRNLEDREGETVPDDVLTAMSEEADRFLRREQIPDFMSGGGGQPSQQTQIGGGSTGGGGDQVDLTNTTREALYSIRRRLDELAQADDDRPPSSASVSRGELLRLLNGPDPALVLVQSENDDRIRNFSSDIINILFRVRRRAGQNTPQVLFVYDEADQFIPGQTGSETSYAASRSAAATVARRGRKFGMGLSIATQRVAYLDTSILAQPHTYFVSKLPREYDRNKMAEAFGITEDMMRHTLRFSVGDWMLVSFDATGLVNVPIPIHLRNANERVREHLEGNYGSTDL